MKKRISILLAAVMCAGMVTSANAEGKRIELTIGSPKMTVDGTETDIDGEGTVPVIVNDRTLVPIRAIIEAVGGTVAWDGEARKVTLEYNGSTIELVIDSVTAVLNGEENTLDVSPVIINGRTMLPIRFVSESFGFDVGWDSEAQKVTISPAPAAKETPVAMEANGFKITMADLMYYVGSYVSAESSEEERAHFEYVKNMLAQDIYDIFLYGECARMEGYGSSEEELKGLYDHVKENAGELVKAGINPEFVVRMQNNLNAFNQIMSADILSEETKQMIDGVLDNNDELKEEFLNSYYRAKHILIDNAGSGGKSAEALAKDISEQAKDGADFDKLIDEYNTDPGMSSNPNGYVFTDNEMVTEFEDCVKSLEPDEIGICRSVYGWHVVKRLPITEQDSDFSVWYEEFKSSKADMLANSEMLKVLDALCEKNGITGTFYSDVIKNYTYDDYSALFSD